MRINLAIEQGLGQCDVDTASAHPIDDLNQTVQRRALKSAVKRHGRACSNVRSAGCSPGEARMPHRDGVPVLQLPLDDVEAFGRRVYNLPVAIALATEQHRCAGESDVWAEVAGALLDSSLSVALSDVKFLVR